jgi:hypothetical protein
MKKYIGILIVGILLTSCNLTKEQETRNLEPFDTVNLVGNMELHLANTSAHSLAIRTRKTDDLTNLITEVRDGELFIYHKNECEHCESPEYDIYLNHSGISGISLAGIVHLRSDDVLSQKELRIDGDGILNGDLEVSVNKLSVDLKGITNMYFSGTADTANLKITGIGMIRATSLKTKSGKSVSDGIAIISD